MKVAFFDTNPFEKEAFDKAAKNYHHEIHYLEPRLIESSVQLAGGFPCVCCFVNDRLNAQNLAALKAGGTQLLALRSAGFNHVDVAAAKKLHIKVVRVPEYSPYAVAEHVVAMIQTLNRKTHRAYNRVREGNFSLNGLVGFDLYGKTVGIIGAGRIGKVLARIMSGFGCRVLLHDLHTDAELIKEIHCSYTSVDDVLEQADIVSLHVPLTPDTHHFINAQTLAKMKNGVMIINTGRGALIDSKALIDALKSGHVGSAGLDVYEEEAGIFFKDLSGQIISDDILARLMTFPNVLITSHQGFLTHEALDNIAKTTLQNIDEFEKNKPLTNEV